MSFFAKTSLKEGLQTIKVLSCELKRFFLRKQVAEYLALRDADLNRRLATRVQQDGAKGAENYLSVQNNATVITANIIFQRQLMYYLANIYFPTISLLVIVEMTLFFDLSRQEVAVTLSLTVMLSCTHFIKVFIRQFLKQLI